MDELNSQFASRSCIAGDENLADYLAHCARTAIGGIVEETSSDLLFAGGHSYPGSFSNGAIRRGLGADVGDPAELADRAADFFARVRRPYLFWIRDHLDADLAGVLLERGFTVREPVDGLSGVAVDVRPDVREVPHGCDLRRVDDEAGFLDYLDVIAAVWQLGDAPRSVMEAVLFSLNSLRTEQMGVFVLYERGRAVSASANYVSGGCGGMQWTGTLKEALGRGFGQLVCAAAWNFAFDKGQDLVVGQASAIGTPVWHKMGFRTVTRYRRFLSPPARR